MKRDVYIYKLQFKEFVGRSDWVGTCGMQNVSQATYVYEKRPQRRHKYMKRDLCKYK